MDSAEQQTCFLLHLPDELLEAIIGHLPPAPTVAFGSTCKRSNKITHEPVVWRRHCVKTWKYWESRHDFEERLELPPAQTRWRRLYDERRRIDCEALELFDQMLLTQQQRLQRMEDIAKRGYDVKDLMRSLQENTSENAEDVLARKYFAAAILGQIHRATAIEKWLRLQRRQMVKLEEVLGAYDLFVLAGAEGDLNDIARELDRIAECVKQCNADFEQLTIRKKAIQVAKYLRSENLVGNLSEHDYYALRNNFISIALFDKVHASLPLQSVAIYCAIARRLGINAKPSNYPAHVHAVIEAPSNITLDGKHKLPIQGAEPELMHMDPWRSADEVPTQQLQLRLFQMGAPAAEHAVHLGSTSNYEIALRTGRNIMNSVTEFRQWQRNAAVRSPSFPDIEAAWYAMVWSMLVLGDSNPASNQRRRRQCLPYLIEHFQAHFPEDLGLVETTVIPMFEGVREHEILVDLINTARTVDRNRSAPSPRNENTQHVKYKIGQHFKHRRYNYGGFIIGWDMRCSAEPRWIEQMRVDDLPGGREQPFYNIIADDKSTRYVAEENIVVSEEQPIETLMQVAGRYFKRWNDEKKAFESNIRDQYPDD